MNEEDRRQEILKAEEVIQQLAKEMAKSSGEAERLAAIRQEFKDATQDINNARESLERSTGILSQSAEQAQKSILSSSSEAAKTLSEYAEKCEQTGTQLSQELDRFQTAIQDLEKVTQSVNSRFEASIGAIEGTNRVLQSIDENLKTLRDTNTTIGSRITSLQNESKAVRWAVIFAILAFVCSLVGVGLILMK